MATRLAWRTAYESDEVALGIALAIALHAIPIAAIILKAMYPSLGEEEKPLVEKPVVAASLLKLGKPMDPLKLPDRIVPRARTAPKHEIVASREEKKKDIPDAGPPPPLAQESDITRLVNKSDPFAEDAGKDRPEEGHAAGVKEGQETDPNKVRAGDMYGALLGNFFHERWAIPTVISQGEANKLCVTFQISIDRRMSIWHMRSEPVRKSGNDLFDDSARSMLQKLLDDRTPLPEPPPEVAEQYRGRALNVGLTGNPHGDSSKCR
ncbi:TonB C-terminal domain-containing protein [Pendulispora brunnea]|uniref:TonB C-terminal domain-containing protein n=1 Tax=Pendulispora brunnea TaxID=2905690 RepID=A0ABZ2KHQ6_9BACT